MNIHPKVMNAGIAGAATLILTFFYGAIQKAVGFDYPLPPEVASAVTLVVMSAIGYGTSAGQ